MNNYILLLKEAANLEKIDLKDFSEKRKESMNKRANPIFILRNYQMEEAI
jgi:uncharacterized protein YdiU (UPF0061 family)